MRFIHTGDIHLGAAPDSLMPWSLERRGEIRDTFMRLLEEAQREKTDLLLIAGDLFHRQPLKKELREVNAEFRARYMSGAAGPEKSGCGVAAIDS